MCDEFQIVIIFLFQKFIADLDLTMTGLLVKKFNLTTFKDWQLRAIKALIDGQDALVVQPTGSGKSLCYQFPAVWLKKTTVVLTPTISLMDDQSSSLSSKGIKATFLGTAQQDKQIPHKLLAGEYEIVFVTPESFFADNGQPRELFKQLYYKNRIGVIALDEAHLFSSWISFR